GLEAASARRAADISAHGGMSAAVSLSSARACTAPLGGTKLAFQSCGKGGDDEISAARWLLSLGTGTFGGPTQRFKAWGESDVADATRPESTGLGTAHREDPPGSAAAADQPVAQQGRCRERATGVGRVRLPRGGRDRRDRRGDGARPSRRSPST